MAAAIGVVGLAAAIITDVLTAVLITMTALRSACWRSSAAVHHAADSPEGRG